MLRRVKKWLARIKPDLVVSILTYPNVYFGNAYSQVPQVKGFVWNQADMGLERVDYDLELQALKKASKVVTNATGSREFLIHEFGTQFISQQALINKIEVVHNIVEIPLIDKPILEIKREFSWKKNQQSVTMVANLTDYKDHQTLIEAWKILTDEIKNAVLYLAGRKDVQYPRLKKLVEDLKLTKSVKFLGAINNVHELLKITDVAVLASNSEGSSNSVAEYMLSSLPIVVTLIPANLELLGENYPYYYQPGEAYDLAAKLKLLLTNKEVAKHVGQQNKTKAQIIFDNQQNMNKYRCLLEEILNES